MPVLLEHYCDVESLKLLESKLRDRYGALGVNVPRLHALAAAEVKRMDRVRVDLTLTALATWMKVVEDGLTEYVSNASAAAADAAAARALMLVKIALARTDCLGGNTMGLSSGHGRGYARL